MIISDILEKAIDDTIDSVEIYDTEKDKTTLIFDSVSDCLTDYVSSKEFESFEIRNDNNNLVLVFNI